MKGKAVFKRGVTVGGTIGGNLSGTAKLAADVQPLPNITIGEVETLAPGSDAYATMTGTQEDPVLNLGIPQGATGEQGVPGQDYVLTSADKSEIAGIVENEIDVGVTSVDGETGAVTGIQKQKAEIDLGEVGYVSDETVLTFTISADNMHSIRDALLADAEVYLNGVFYMGIQQRYTEFRIPYISTLDMMGDPMWVFGGITSDTNLSMYNLFIGCFGSLSQFYCQSILKGSTVLDDISGVRTWAENHKADAADTDLTHTALRAASIPFGKLDSTSTSTVMTATVPGITALANGVCVWLMNGVVTSASGFTIDINGLGAKPVYSSQAAASRSTTIFSVNYTALLIYNEERVDGGCWDYVYGYDSNTNTIGYQIRTNSSTRNMTDKMYRYRLMFSSADDKKFVPANDSTSTNTTTARTPCQTPINPFGDIMYYGTTAAIAAGDAPAAANLWQQYVPTLGYSFTGITLTAKNPVYLVCNPQTNGSAIIDSTTPIAQELPSTADGKIYIYLGIATSGTAFELKLNHPVYHYYNGSIRLWTGPV